MGFTDILNNQKGNPLFVKISPTKKISVISVAIYKNHI